MIKKMQSRHAGNRPAEKMALAKRKDKKTFRLVAMNSQYVDLSGFDKKSMKKYVPLHRIQT